MPVHDSTFLKRVVLKNYKSIAACDVELGPLTFLVGPNGAGKSNFLDALRFVADALRTSLAHAIRDRGGINEVRRRSGGHPTHFGARLEFRLRSGEQGHYAFQIAALTGGKYEVQEEECEIFPSEDVSTPARFRVKQGVVQSTTHPGPPAVSDRLYLVNEAGLSEFRPIYDALQNMGFYNLNPDEIRLPQQPEPEGPLERDGWNIASVLAHLAATDGATKRRIEEYLGQVSPGVTGVDVKETPPYLTLEFGQTVAGARHPWRFAATSMSDGTLRALGVLVALFQSPDGAAPWVPLVGIEEPEVALHPAAAGVLRDSLWDASQERQIIITSHSPDLLDDPDLDTSAILAVVAEDGISRIGPVDEAGRSVLRDHLYTAGELLRLNQLSPDLEKAKRAASGQVQLFGAAG
jgi:predicted ATPase